MRKSIARRQQSAFSLVEVVLAVGVIAFAFVAILGLLPAGLQQFRQAMDNSVGAQISQRIILECQQTDFDVLTNSSNSSTQTAGYTYRLPSYSAGDLSKVSPLYVRYFDEQGNEMVPQGSTPTPTELATVVYYVNTRVATSTQLAVSTGSGTNSAGNPVGLSFGIATVTVQVAFNPGNLTIPVTNNLFDTSLPQYRGVTVKTYSAQVGRND